MSDKNFYGKDGGITFSGGEPLLFLPQYYTDLCNKLHEEGINLCVETALFVPQEAVKWMTNSIDYFYIDIKILNPNKCKTYLGGNLVQYLNNMNIVHEKKGDKKIVYRVPLIHGYTDSEENLDSICKLMEKFPPYRVEILKAHNLGKKKYERLGREYTDFSSPDGDRIEALVKRILASGITVEVKQI